MDNVSVLEAMLGKMKDILKTDTVFGEPLKVGDTMIIPVVKIGFGFGGSQAKDSKGGMGGGGMISPVAMVVVKEGNVHIVPVHQKDKPTDRLLNRLPEYIDRVLNKIDKKPGVTFEEGEDNL